MSPIFLSILMLNALLLWLLVGLRGRGYWLAKATVIVLVLGFSFLVWAGRDSGRGWPVRTALPERALFVACIVNEPDPSTGSAGSIYVWEIPISGKVPLFGYRSSATDPRAYRIAYDRSLHEACVAAGRATQRGEPASIRRLRRHESHGNMSQGAYVAYLLPPLMLPSKG